ncbi:MAG: complement resistance protein TraT [Candidatus Dadabacteria bacterium]|nr:complement resistance protein TraT [Candidatus Dadabacteria bacterium]
MRGLGHSISFLTRGAGALVLLLSLLAAGCGPKFNPSDAASGKQTSTGVKVRPEIGIPKEPSLEYIRVRMADSIFLNPPEVDNPSVYVRIRNTSGKDIDLQGVVIQKLRSLGYKLTRNASSATYVLQANLLFADEVSAAELAKIDETKYGFSLTRTAAGLLVGAGLGAGAGALLGEGDITGETIVGGVVGGAVGAIGQALSQRERDKRLAAKQWIKYFSLVVDIQLKERASGEVKIEGSSAMSSSQGLEHESDLGDNRGGSESSYGRRETQTYSETSRWKSYRTRVIGKAKGKLIVFEDVRRDFAEQLANSIAGLF